MLARINAEKRLLGEPSAPNMKPVARAGGVSSLYLY
jgi:hypothetical protein